MKLLYTIAIIALIGYSPSILGCKGSSQEERILEQIKKIQEHIEKNKPIKKPDKNLPELILKYSIKHDLEPRRLSAIFMQESSYRLNAVNKKSNDYGIGQVNAIHGLDKKRLTSDLEYSIQHSARILGQFKKRYSKQEPEVWYCRYNIGTGKLVGNKKSKCLAYLKKVNRYY